MSPGQIRFLTLIRRETTRFWKIKRQTLGAPLEDVKKQYRMLVAHNHPDRLIARGVPEEFVKIATARIAAINGAFEIIERGLRAA